MEPLTAPMDDVITGHAAVHLLGRPRIDRSAGSRYQFRSRKSWAVLAYLLLSERPPTRSQLSSLLFSDADDPARALRWSLTEIRRGLGELGTVDGDPVVLDLADGTVVDVDVVTKGAWQDAVELPGLGADLLEGMGFRGAAAFEIWLLATQRKVAGASEAMLHEAALGLGSQGTLDAAIGYASRATAMNPLDENHQALLIRLYRLAGNDAAAERQLAACTELFHRRLGTEPGPGVLAAARTRREAPQEVTDEATVVAVIEAGSAAIAAGAVDAGIRSLRTATRLADASRSDELRVSSRIALAEALIHSLRGMDEEGLALLCDADDIATAHGLLAAAAHARAERGYVDFLRARYDRAEVWLSDALRAAGDEPSRAKALTYLGCVESDRGNYSRAAALLGDAVEVSRAAGDVRREAYAKAMLGRVNLFRNELDVAATQLDESIAMAERDHWLAVLPLPEALRGEVQLARSDPAGAERLFRRAFARACQLGDPCWEGISARGLALATAAAGTQGAVAGAFELLADARTRADRVADPYVWLDAHILDAQCVLGLRHGHPDTGRWIEDLRELASRTGMREFTVRSLLHGAAQGNAGDAAAAVLLAPGLDSPDLLATVRSAQRASIPG